jgi:phosphate transport system permease protein
MDRLPIRRQPGGLELNDPFGRPQDSTDPPLQEGSLPEASGADAQPPAHEPGAPTDIPDLSGPLTPSGNLRRRQLVSRFFEAGQTGAALLAVAVLGIVIYSVIAKGASVLSLSFLTHAPPLVSSEPGGGIAPEIVGTIVIVALATVIATPVGILSALYLTEFASTWTANAFRLVLDLLNGVPSIIIGLFVFGLLVVGHTQSGFAASVALAIIMLPLIARATQETLLLVPSGMREAADALGISRWRTVRGVVLPTARGGIMTATVLSVARAAGETAPLLLVSSVAGPQVAFNPFGHPLPNIPVYIFESSEAADPNGFARAWGAALVLMAFILFANIVSRTLSRRSALSR